MPTVTEQLQEIHDLIEKKMKDEIKDVRGDIDSMKDREKKNQDAIDKLIVQAQRGHISQGLTGKTFNQALNDCLNEGDNYKNIDMFVNKHNERKREFSIELKSVGDITTANVTPTSVYGQQFQPGIIQRPARRVHLRSLLPVGTAGPGNTLTHMRESGNGEGTIAPVSEGSTKNQIDFDWTEDTVNFETIAGWLRVTNKAMRNIPGFLSWLNARLPERLLRAEDTQILTGDGNTPNLKGILTSGNFTASTSTADTLVEAIIDDLALLEDTNEREGNGILLRPVDYYSFFKNKASGSGEYDLPANVSFSNGTLYISGVPVYPSTAMSSGSYLVGDWIMGAQLLVQDAIQIRFFEQDSDNAQKNKTTIRIEETVALPVYGSDFWVKGAVPSVS